MLRKAFLAIALVASLSASAMAADVVGGDHSFDANTGLQTFSISATSASGETLQGLDLYLVMDQLGPIITNVNLITGTVFEPNNFGQTSFGLPEYETPGRQPAYSTGTNSGSVPLGIVALVTIDTTGVAPGVYTLALSNDILGPSAAYNNQGVPGGFVNGTVTIVGVPEPGSIVLGLFAAAGLGAVVIRRRRARNA